MKGLAWEKAVRSIWSLRTSATADSTGAVVVAASGAALAGISVDVVWEVA